MVPRSSGAVFDFGALRELTGSQIALGPCM